MNDNIDRNNNDKNNTKIIQKKTRNYRNNKKNYSKRFNFKYNSLILHNFKVIKTITGGRKMSYVIIIAISNFKTLGLGVGKSVSFFTAKQKAFKQAEKNLISDIPMTDDFSIPFPINVSFKNLKFIMKPRKSVGIKSGSVARLIFNLIGYKKISSKFIKGLDHNKINAVKIVEKAIKTLKKIYENKKIYNQFLNQKSL